MRRFLVSRLSSLGDVVCTLPVASALKSTFSDAQIVWAVDPRFAGIVECCASVDEVVRCKPGISPKSWPVYDGEFEAALDMQGLAKSGLAIARAKAKTKVGYHWQREGAWLFSSRVLPDETSFHIVDQYVDVARAAGAVADKAVFNLVPAPEAVQSVKDKLEARTDLVILNPGAGWVTKRWPPQHFAALADDLSGVGLTPVLIGGTAEGDKQAGAEVLMHCKSQPLNLIGRTNIKELIALISLSKAHIGGDTGSTHIAAALGVPAIGLYSITRPKRSCPYGQLDRCHYNSEGLSHIMPGDVSSTLKEAIA